MICIASSLPNLLTFVKNQLFTLLSFPFVYFLFNSFPYLFLFSPTLDLNFCFFLDFCLEVEVYIGFTLSSSLTQTFSAELTLGASNKI